MEKIYELIEKIPQKFTDIVKTKHKIDNVKKIESLLRGSGDELCLKVEINKDTDIYQCYRVKDESGNIESKFNRININEIKGDVSFTAIIYLQLKNLIIEAKESYINKNFYKIIILNDIEENKWEPEIFGSDDDHLFTILNHGEYENRMKNRINLRKDI